MSKVKVSSLGVNYRVYNTNFTFDFCFALLAFQCGYKQDHFGYE